RRAVAQPRGHHRGASGLAVHRADEEVHSGASGVVERGYWDVILRRRDRTVRLGPAIAVELPEVTDLADHVEVEVADDDVVGVAGGGGQDLAARVAEVALPVELADAPRIFPAGTVDGPHEIAVGDGVCGLFQLPKVFRQTGDGRRGVEDDFGACQAQA